MDANEYIRKRNEDRKKASEEIRKNFPNVQIGNFVFSVLNRAGESFSGDLCQPAEESLSWIGNFIFLYPGSGFYKVEALVSIQQNIEFDLFSEENLERTISRIGFLMGIKDPLPATARVIVGGSIQYSATESDQNLIRD